jgi:parallel beta-helix repeat protein
MFGRVLRSALVAAVALAVGAGGAAAAATPASAAPLQTGVNAGGPAYTSAAAVTYAADSGFSGGATTTTAAGIGGTAEDGLFQSVHYGMTDWSTAVPTGTYRVTMDFAETAFSTAGARVFSVTSAGIPLVTNLDLYAKVGMNQAYLFTKDLKVTGGTLDLKFSATADKAVVSAISVTSLSTAQPLQGVPVALTQSIQAAVDANPAGTTFLLQAGVYRMQPITPKSNDTFTGQNGTILSGARVLTGWTQSGSTWTVGGQTQNQDFYGQCDDTHPLCVQPEDLFIDGVLIAPVATAGAVVAGTWFFDHSASTITIGVDPAGHAVETSVTPKAFDGLADNVTVQNMTIQMYATELQNGTIQAGPLPGGSPDGGSNWLLQDLTVKLNHGVGIAMGNGTVVRRVHALQNGNLGISGTSASGGVVDSSEIAGNNTVGVEQGWSAGGAKWAGDYNNLVVQNTSVHDNNGPGLWADESDYNTTFINNTVTNNSAAGIFVEISYKALVANNIVTNNGLAVAPGWLWGSGIQIAASSDVEVTGNTLQGNRNGISGIQQNRGSGTMGLHLVQNLNVHGNTVSLGAGGTGIVTDTGDTSVFTSMNNHFVNNTWTNATVTWPFAWNNVWNTQTQWTATGNS